MTGQAHCTLMTRTERWRANDNWNVNNIGCRKRSSGILWLFILTTTTMTYRRHVYLYFITLSKNIMYILGGVDHWWPGWLVLNWKSFSRSTGKPTIYSHFDILMCANLNWIETKSCETRKKEWSVHLLALHAFLSYSNILGIV